MRLTKLILIATEFYWLETDYDCEKESKTTNLPCKHVIHESSKAPPVNCFPMARPLDNLWSPGGGPAKVASQLSPDELHQYRESIKKPMTF